MPDIRSVRILIVAILYAWDQAAGLPQMLQDSDGNTYVYGLDLISMTDGGDDTVYFLCDGLGSTTGLTDEAGDEIASYEYDVFGAVRDHTGPGSTEFTYTGEQNDPTGL